MMTLEHQYLELLEQLEAGCFRPREDRTGVGAVANFGPQISDNMYSGFPLLTTKKIHFKSVLVELLWMLRGDTNTKFLKDHGVSIWDEWADENGDLGPVYGVQWRGTSGGPDQIQQVFESLRDDPHSRRHVVSAWNPSQIPDMALAPCHCMFQFFVSGPDYDRRLSLHLYQRSADIFLGVPFNIASYALLLHIFAHKLGYAPAELIITFGDLHLYSNHREQAATQIRREPRSFPKLVINADPSTKFEDFKVEDFQLIGYDPHPAIPAPVAV